MIPAAAEGVEWATVGPIAIVVGVVVVGAAMLLSLFVRRGERQAGPELQVFGPEEAVSPPPAPPPVEPPPAAPPPVRPPPAAPPPVESPPAVPDRALSALDEDIDELAARLRRLGGGRRDET